MCQFANKSFANVEVQNSSDCDHMRRVRYYEALLTLFNTPKGGENGDKFAIVPDVYSIYIMNFDYFHVPGTRFVIGRNLKTFDGSAVDVAPGLLYNGHTEIFLNATYNDDSEVSAFLEMMRDPDVYDKRFENFCEMKNELLFTERGKEMINFSMDEHDKEMRKQGYERGVKRGVKQGVEKTSKENAALAQALLERGRTDDCFRLLTDGAFREQLLAEFFPDGL